MKPGKNETSGYMTVHRAIRREKIIKGILITVVVVGILYVLIAHLLPALELW